MALTSVPGLPRLHVLLHVNNCASTRFPPHNDADWNYGTEARMTSNEGNKRGTSSGLLKAVENLYKNTTVERNTNLSLTNKTDETRCQIAAVRKCQCQQRMYNDKDSEFGPPDKSRKFSKDTETAITTNNVYIGRFMEVKYDDSVWYRGNFNASTNECIAEFEINGEHPSIKFPDDDIHSCTHTHGLLKIK